MPQMDRFSITFYHDEQVEIATKFREMLKQEGKSINEVVIELITKYIS